MAATEPRNSKADTGTASLVCPDCGSHLIRRSMRRSFKDRFKSFFGRWPYRCDLCHKRFDGPRDPESIERDSAARRELSGYVDEKPKEKRAEHPDLPL